MEANSDRTSISQLLHYHKVGTEYIKKALSIDEQSSKIRISGFGWFRVNDDDSFGDLF